MKKLGLLLMIVFSCSLMAKPQDISAYFERPLSCPLRFSNLSGLRDQVQILASTLSSNCSQTNQQALAQLNSGVANLEGIASSWKTFSAEDEKANQAQIAKNLTQVLGNLNVITSNQSCFYDIRARGALPVISDVIMSLSQFGLLIPSSTGMYVAAGGYVLGSGLRIVNELVKKKFNFNRPEERRAFLQINCAFFDYRKQMDEAALFKPESLAYRNNLLDSLKQERAMLIREKRNADVRAQNYQKELDQALLAIPEASQRGLNPGLARDMDELAQVLLTKPSDYGQKLKQVTFLSTMASRLQERLATLSLELKPRQDSTLLKANLDRIIPELAPGGKAWTNSIDEYEVGFRGPLMAYLPEVAASLKNELTQIEAEYFIEDPEHVKSIMNLKLKLNDENSLLWARSLRISSLSSKITNLENSKNAELFSDLDESSSSAVEILEYYRQLQDSILGKEGKGYLESSLSSSYELDQDLENQLKKYSVQLDPKERCSVAEKIRFAWAQYRYKVQEVHDFAATNFDLSRSLFKMKKGWFTRPGEYVLFQINSVETFLRQESTSPQSAGDLMKRITDKQKKIETLLEESKCF